MVCSLHPPNLLLWEDLACLYLALDSKLKQGQFDQHYVAPGLAFVMQIICAQPIFVYLILHGFIIYWMNSSKIGWLSVILAFFVKS